MRQRGRGAVSNRAGRFDPVRETTEDGWPGDGEDIAPPPLRTDLRMEQVRRAITYNRSPDLPFDRSVNPYRGCEHGCVYCFARPSHAYLGLSPGLDFETRLIARPDIATALTRDLRAPGYRVAPIAIGTNTDPYQPVEAEHGLMRACLKVLAACDHPVAIVTKGTLIERDIDILAPMAARGFARVGVSLTTLDRDLARRMEPRAPTPSRRLRTIARLSGAGIPVRVMQSPLIPGLTDTEIEPILRAAQAAGARTASWIMLRLPGEVAPLWREWLDIHYPDRAAKILRRLEEMHGGRLYDARFEHRMRGEGVHAGMIAQRWHRAMRSLGLAEAAPPLRCDLFRRPQLPGDQMSLF